MKLGVFIGSGVNAFAVFAEASARIRDFFASALGREQNLVTRVGIDHPKVALVGGNLFVDKDLAAIGRPGKRLPPTTFELSDQVIGLGVGRIHREQIDVLTRAPRRAVGQLAATLEPNGAGVAGLAIGEQGDVARGYVIAIELVKLSSAYVFAEDEVISLLRFVLCAADRVGVEGQLRSVSSGHFYLVNL